MTLLQYFVCCITHSFQLWRQTFSTALNNAQLKHPFTRGIHDSKHAFVPMPTFQTWRKVIGVEKKRRNIIPRERVS